MTLFLDLPAELWTDIYECRSVLRSTDRQHLRNCCSAVRR